MFMITAIHRRSAEAQTLLRDIQPGSPVPVQEIPQAETVHEAESAPGLFTLGSQLASAEVRTVM